MRYRHAVACAGMECSGLLNEMRHSDAICIRVAATEIEELELALNEITPEGASTLAAALAGKSKLQKLNLRENELEDRGAILLSKPVQSLPSLRILDLAQNQVCYNSNCGTRSNFLTAQVSLWYCLAHAEACLKTALSHVCVGACICPAGTG